MPNTPMHRRFRTLLILAGFALASLANALGLGEIESQTRLGEPLEAVVPVLDTGSSYRAGDLQVRKLDEARAEALGFDSLASLYYRLDFTLQNRDDGVVVVIRSQQSIREPFLNFQLELLWPSGSVVRDFTLFFDPSAPVETAATQVAPKVEQGQQILTPVAAMRQRLPSTSARRSAPVRVLTGRPAGADGGETYQVRPGDTLSGIAAQFSGRAGATVAEVADWLLDNNPRAFIAGDRNRILAGARLLLPSEMAASPAAASTPAPATDTAESSRAQAWMQNLPTRKQEVTQAADTVASSGGETAAVAAEGSVSASSSATEGSGVAGAGLLRLSQQTGEADSIPSFAELDRQSPEAMRAYLEQTRETRDRIARENDDLLERIEKIENSEYLNNLKDMVELQNQQLQALKAQGVGEAAGASSGTGISKASASDGGADDFAVTSTPERSVVELNAATPASETVDRSRARLWIAMGLFALAMVLFVLILRRLWERQQTRYRTLDRPIPEQPTVVGGSASPQARAQADLDPEDLTLSAEDLKQLDKLDVPENKFAMIDGVGQARTIARPETSKSAKPKTGQRTQSQTRQSHAGETPTVDDDWDDLFDAITRRASVNGEPESFELELDLEDLEGGQKKGANDMAPKKKS